MTRVLYFPVLLIYQLLTSVTIISRKLIAQASRTFRRMTQSTLQNFIASCKSTNIRGLSCPCRGRCCTGTSSSRPQRWPPGGGFSARPGPPWGPWSPWTPWPPWGDHGTELTSLVMSSVATQEGPLAGDLSLLDVGSTNRSSKTNMMSRPASRMFGLFQDVTNRQR